jgi:hypothetical protein
MPHGKICYLEIPANRAEDSARFYSAEDGREVSAPSETERGLTWCAAGGGRRQHEPSRLKPVVRAHRYSRCSSS